MHAKDTSHRSSAKRVLNREVWGMWNTCHHLLYTLFGGKCQDRCRGFRSFCGFVVAWIAIREGSDLSVDGLRSPLSLYAEPSSSYLRDTPGFSHGEERRFARPRATAREALGRLVPSFGLEENLQVRNSRSRKTRTCWHSGAGRGARPLMIRRLSIVKNFIRMMHGFVNPS